MAAKNDDGCKEYSVLVLAIFVSRHGHENYSSPISGRRSLMTATLQDLAANLVARGKGILAADETVPTLTRRFDALGVSSTADSRRSYREMLFTFGGTQHGHGRSAVVPRRLGAAGGDGD